MNGIKKWLALFALSFGYASIYLVPYARYIFYDPMMKALNCTNLQLGAMVSVFAGIGIATYLPGGWLADRFSTKKIITISLIVQGLLTIWFGLSMSLTVGWIVWVAFSFTSCFGYWAAVLKGVRMLGSKEEQGRLFGFLESGVGIWNVLIGFVALAIFDKYVDQVEGFKTVVLLYAGFTILAGILTWLLYDDYMTESQEDEKTKVSIKDVLVALKDPALWLIAAVVFTTYGMYVGLTYFTPYLTAVVGITVTFSGALALIRTHGVKFLSGPCSGFLADKVRSSCKVLIGGYGVSVLFIAVFLFLPDKPSVGLVMALMLTAAFIISGMKGIMWSTVEEAKIPRYYTGIAVGTVSIIGYLPDIYMGPLFGYWLDIYGNQGYNYMFMFLMGQCVLGILAAYGIIARSRKAGLQECTKNTAKF